MTTVLHDKGRSNPFGEMRESILVLCLALAGCTTPVVSLQKSEIDRFAVVEIDLQAWLGDNTKGEFAYVSHIDGIWEEKYALKKAGRSRPDGPLVKYLLLEPGVRELTFVYNRNVLGPVGRKLWSGGVTEKAEVTSGHYAVRYAVEGKFVTLWLEDSNGVAVTEKRRSVIAEVAPQSPTVIPIVIPR